MPASARDARQAPAQEPSALYSTYDTCYALAMSDLTVAEAAAALQCSASTVHRKIKAGELAARRLGPRLIRVEREGLESFIGKSLTGGQVNESKDG